MSGDFTLTAADDGVASVDALATSRGGDISIGDIGGGLSVTDSGGNGDGYASIFAGPFADAGDLTIDSVGGDITLSATGEMRPMRTSAPRQI